MGDHRIDDELAEPVTPAILTASLHVQPEQVTAVDLRPDGDLVSLRLGDNNAQIAVLGSLQTVFEILAEAASSLAAIKIAREARR